MESAFHMRHFRVDLEGVEVGEALPTILARVPEIALVDALYMRVQGAPTGQHLAAPRTGIWFGL